MPPLAEQWGVLVCSSCTTGHKLSPTVHLISSTVGGSNTNVLYLDRIALEDFCRFFADLDICSLCPDFLDGSSSCHWTTSCYEGRWVAGVTAGGCMNNIGIWTPLAPPGLLTSTERCKRIRCADHWYVCPPESFWTNPQYRVKVDELPSECSSSGNDNTMLVSLMQKPDKRNRRLVQNLHIGFSVFEVSWAIYRLLWEELLETSKLLIWSSR